MGVPMASLRNLAAGRRARTTEPTTTTVFGVLPLSIANELEAISFPIHYPDAAKLFNEGEPARGLYVIQSGRVKLYLTSVDGRTLILRMAKAGDVLGLPGTLSGRQYEVTAETLGPCQLVFIKRDPFLRLMNCFKEIGIGVAQQLSSSYISACHEIRCLGLSQTSGEKLAMLLLEWPMSAGDTASRIKFAFRHEDVAQMIGISRETVSRLFVEFKKRKLAELDGSTLYIRDRQLLQLIADGKTLISPFMGRRSNGAEKPRSSPEQRVSDGDSSSHFYPDGV
jgi:CRP/FNR family transcriptional regulator, cyclic AMP receptor protein